MQEAAELIARNTKSKMELEKLRHVAGLHRSSIIQELKDLDNEALSI